MDEAVQFGIGGFGRIGGVADVHHAVRDEVAADGSLVGLLRVGRPEEFTHSEDDADNRPAPFQQGSRRIDRVYDFMGRRIEKATWEKTILTKRLRYIYHGYVQIAEIDATDETAPYVAKTYRWAPSEPVATRPIALSLWTREGTERETLYYAHDLRKNVVSLFDAKGLRRASYQYDPYGNIIAMEGDMAEENPFRFSSEHHDEDLGLVYYNFRHYNPTDGKWIPAIPSLKRVA